MKRALPLICAIAILACSWLIFDSQVPSVQAEKANDKPIPKGSIQIERLTEAEKIISHIGQRSWVFKHEGSDITSQFVIYYRANGKFTEEKVLFKANGDSLFNAIKFMPNSVRRVRSKKSGGYLIVSFGENVLHSLSVGSISTADQKPRKGVFQDTILANRELESKRISSAKELAAKQTIPPGKTVELINETVFIQSRADKGKPILDAERFRYVLTATNIKDGILPKREENEN